MVSMKIDKQWELRMGMLSFLCDNDQGMYVPLLAGGVTSAFSTTRRLISFCLLGGFSVSLALLARMFACSAGLSGLACSALLSLLSVPGLLNLSSLLTACLACLVRSARLLRLLAPLACSACLLRLLAPLACSTSLAYRTRSLALLRLRTCLISYLPWLPACSACLLCPIAPLARLLCLFCLSNSLSVLLTCPAYCTHLLLYLFFLIPFIILAITLALPPSSISDPGSHSRPSCPLPTTVHAFIFIAKTIQHFLSLVDSRRIADSSRIEPTHAARRSQQLTLFLDFRK